MASAFEDAGHLPNLRAGRQPADPYRLPRQRRGVTPQMHGRYPDHDVMAEAEAWDEPTRTLIRGRVDDVPQIRFFTEPEQQTLGRFCDDVLAQDAEPRVPVLAAIDDKLHAGRLDGFQYDDMPDDRDTWRLVAAGLDEAAQAHGAGSYADADDRLRTQILDGFAAGRLTGRTWERLNVARAWSVVMRAVLSAFYAHPWVWNEIGFGGPAYPRGYARMGVGLNEPWEADEALHVDPVSDVKRRGLE
jgi:Gluconate 2-dehydrogenase subunit 3